ncbi:MAG: hypothetical protein HY329_17510, partial [Chloroflexi bacterium]|nr:hypothetical protein [Chloroflexota bacterium]
VVDPPSRSPAVPLSRSPAQSSVLATDPLATERERVRVTRLARYQQALAALGVGNSAVQLEPSVALAPVLGSWQSAYAQLVNAQTPEELWEAEAALDRVERELYVLIPPRRDQSAVSAAPADRPPTQLELYRASTSSEENRARAVGGGTPPGGPPGLAGTSDGVPVASSVRAPTGPARPLLSSLEDHPPLPAVAAERERMLRLQQRWLDKTIDALDYSGVFELEALFISNLLRQWERHYDALKSARSLEAIAALTELMAEIRRELERLVEGHVARQQRSTPLQED